MLEYHATVLEVRAEIVKGTKAMKTIHDVPDGSHTLKVWHSKLKGSEKSVAVKGATEADFQIAR